MVAEYMGPVLSEIGQRFVMKVMRVGRDNRFRNRGPHMGVDVNRRSEVKDRYSTK